MNISIKKLIRIGSALAALAMTTATAVADTHIWTGLGGSAFWSDTHNWANGAPPYYGEPPPCVLRFPSAAAQTFNTNDIPGLLVDELLLDRAGYILDLGDIRLTSSIRLASPFPGQSRLYGKPVLASDVTIDIASDLELVTFADVGETGSGSGFAKLGDGKLTLAGNNTFKGLVRIVLGLVEVTSNTGLGEADAGVVTEDGGGLSLVNVTIKGESLTLAYDGPKGFASLYGTGKNEWIGPVEVARDASIGTAGPMDEIKLNGVLSGSAALKIRGAGQVILAGDEDNSFVGLLTVSEGLLLLDKSNALAVPGALIISDNTASATVRPLGPEQIADDVLVKINPMGRLEMFNHSFETIAGLTGQGEVVFDHGTLVVGANNANATFQGRLAGTGNAGYTNLIKIGTGNFQLLNNTHTHDGLTIVRGGLLRMDATLLASLILVEDGGTLGGRGTCGAVQVNPRGRITGSHVGGTARLTVDSIPFSPGAVFHADLAGTTPDTGHDQLRVTGGQNLNNAFLRVNYNYAGTPGDTFVILDNQNPSPINGTFAGLPEGAVFTTNGIAFRITYQGGTGNDVALTLLAPPAQAEIKLIDYVSGEAKILAGGSIGFTYNVEANDDLGNSNNWVLLGTATVGGAGTMAFTDLEAVNYPHRFYRFVVP
jgi:autotransporter-associated beta strand protein